MQWIWSDLHLNHPNILKYENRPFSSVEEQTKHFINVWKETVGKNDEIYNLGDVAFKISKEELSDIIHNLPGKKILVLGNHDRGRSISWWRDVGFHEVFPYPIIVKKCIILSHEPLYVGENSPYGNIHGHLHGSDFTLHHTCSVCVERIDYRPIDLAIPEAILRNESPTVGLNFADPEFRGR